MKSNRKEIGIAVIGAGGIGNLRAHSCQQISQVDYIAMCDIDSKKLNTVADSVKADIATNDYKKAILNDDTTWIHTVLLAAEPQRD